MHARGAAFSGLWIHDAIGLYVTPLAVAILYYVIPAATRRPIFSHFLSMLGFWLLFFLYPLNGTHHYIFSVIPMGAQIGAITASTLLGVDVILVVANLLLSLRGAGWFPCFPLALAKTCYQRPFAFANTARLCAFGPSGARSTGFIAK